MLTDSLRYALAMGSVRQNRAKPKEPASKGPEPVRKIKPGEPRPKLGTKRKRGEPESYVRFPGVPPMPVEPKNTIPSAKVSASANLMDPLIVFKIPPAQGGSVFSLMNVEDIRRENALKRNARVPTLSALKSLLKKDGLPWHADAYEILGPEGMPVVSDRTLGHVLEMLAQSGNKMSFWSVSIKVKYPSALD